MRRMFPRRGPRSFSRGRRICRATGFSGLAAGAGILAALLGGTAAKLHGTANAPRGNLRPAGDSSFALFETGQVRPLAMSPDGRWLFAANTPANRLEIFAIAPASEPTKASGQSGVEAAGDLTWVRSVPVGLEPVAVAARSSSEVWIVNHLSDSVSIIDLHDLPTARVVRTLLVGDEPRDIVFGGPKHDRAFITTAHRGQNSPVDPQLTTPGVGRADVWVFDANHLGDAAAGTPLAILTLFCDTPRALAVTPDGRTVYAASFLSGNGTTTIPVGSVSPRGGLPPPLTNFQGIEAPKTGLIVKFRQSPTDGQMHWLDELDRNWDDTLRLSLPDLDVFAIDAAATPPVLDSDNIYAGVGTVIFNMAVNPATGQVYVTNTDAQNHNRFEGPGEFAGHTVRGHLAESRVTVLDNGAVLPRHLNKHIDYSRCCAEVPNAESVRSLAFPTDLVVSSDGQTLYVAAFGSSKIGIFDTGALDDDSFVPDTANQIAVSGGGPSGLALNESAGLLYVLTRFDDGISIVDLATRQEIRHDRMWNPEPPSVVKGRRFLYDASITSSHGDSACASCHIFGDFDGLAWDLGNPDGEELPNPGPFAVPPPGGDPQPFHPMKGPMTTQSLRGMDNHGPMHWRGDRTGGNDAPSSQPNRGSFDEEAGFKKFNVAFPGLLGRSSELTDEEMQAFTDFALQIMYPPNPIRQLDNALTDEQQAGRDFYVGDTTGGLPSDTAKTCNGCHVLDPDGNREFPEVARPGFFGTDGQYSFENEFQLFKIPHLRNMYQKVGMFGMAPDPFFPVDPTPFMGDQVRGFGFLHDGSADTLFRFHGAGVFVQTDTNPGGIPLGPEGETIRRQLEAFLLAFDSNFAPIVGQQVTLRADNVAGAGARIDLFESRAAAGECDLLVRGLVHGQPAAFLYGPADAVFNPVPSPPGSGSATGSAGNSLSDEELRALARQPNGELTFTCLPPKTSASRRTAAAAG